MRIYLASPYSRREEMEGYARLLESGGHTITSRWLTGMHEIPGRTEETYTREESASFASADLDDIAVSDMILCFTERARAGHGGRGGRHVEAGFAMALGIRVAVVGPIENCFYALPDVTHYPHWIEAHRDLCPEGR